MLMLALRMLRHRIGSAVATLVALSGGVTILMALAALAAARTMIMAALARGRELVLLRLVGVTTRQVKLLALVTTVAPVSALLRTPPVDSIGIKE
ncbi:hypothetical protein [Micromonospora sp. WMMD708]|uniref:hypothetical protein n=1 Tax=Micromonospora sp. WMMD708 TaxID=3403464 RepID=UPI003BF539A6